MSVPPGDPRSFIANDDQTGTLLVALHEALGDIRPELIRIATAYFTPDGFLALQDGLHHGKDVRILLGERPFLGRRGPGESFGDPENPDRGGPVEAIDWFEFLEGRIPWVLMNHEQRKALLVSEGEEAFESRKVFDLAAWSKVERLVSFLSADLCAVRRYLGKSVGTIAPGKVLAPEAAATERLHAKAYILRAADRGLGVIGSSNLTKGGLQNNVEANLLTRDLAQVDDLDRWFGRKWEQGQDCKEEFIRLLEDCVLFGRRFHPFQVFLKALHVAYGQFLGLGLGEDLAQRLALFQQEGVTRAVELLERHWGAMVCDSVGLGKTYTGMGIVSEFMKRRGGGKALVICPAQLEGNWSPERLRGFDIAGETVSMEYLPRLADLEEVAGESERRQLARRLKALQDFDLILVDESHNFRNPGTKRYRTLMEVIRGGAKPDKRVLLLTATPINNSLWDLYHQLMLITRGDNSWYVGRGPVANLEGTFRQLERSGGGPGLLETMLLTLVRRTRCDIRQRQDSGEPMEVGGQPLVFPRHNIPEAITYSLEAIYQGVYQQVIGAIEKLNFAVYNLEAYGVRRAGDEPLAEQALKRNLSFIGIVRTNFLKRMESSVAALSKTLRSQVDYLDLFLRLLDMGKVLFPKDRDRLKVMLGGSLSDDTIEEWGQEAQGNEFWERLPKIDATGADAEKLSEDVRADRDTLAALLEIIGKLKAADPAHDPKVAELRKKLEELPRHDERGVRTKVVIFTNYRDTADHLARALTGVGIAGFSGKTRMTRTPTWGPYVSVLSGSDDKKRRQQILERFAPLAALRGERNLDDPDLLDEIAPYREEGIDILIATDVLSEGQNLQDAQYLINYDLHWNPVRMIQRAGRVDRLFSPHREVSIFNIMPEKGLEELLKLVKRLRQRVMAIDATVGLDASVLGEVIEEKAIDDLMKIRQGGQAADQVYIEGERRQEFDDALDQLKEYIEMVRAIGTEEVRTLPDGIYNIKTGKQPGVFIMLKMPQEYGGEVFWRFYPMSGEEAITSAAEITKRIVADKETPRAEIGAEENPFTHLVGPLERAIAELNQEYKKRVAAEDPGELVRAIRRKLQPVEVMEADPDLADKFHAWCDLPHPSDILKRDDAVTAAYRKLKVATEPAFIVESLRELWINLEAKGLDRPLPRPTSLENVEVKRAQRGTPRRMWFWKSTRRPCREVSKSPFGDNETDIVNIRCTYEELAACSLSGRGSDT